MAESTKQEEKSARGAKKILALAAGLFLAINAAILLKVFLPSGTPAADLTKPVLAQRHAEGSPVFDPSKSVEFLQAAQSPELFRQADRVYRFESLLLSGDPKTYRDLLKHFHATKDWVLTYVDHTSLVFRRAPAREWQPSDLDELRAHFEKRPERDRVLFEVQLAARLLAVNQSELAKKELDQALKLDANFPEVWTQIAAWNGSTGRWKEAAENVEKALKLRKNYGPALAMKAQTYYALGRFSEAFLASNSLIQAGAHDPQNLFLHARIAHQVHAYTHEIDALRKLIEQAQSAKQSTSGYRIYLGQAYAKRGETGDPEQALKEFNAALDAGDLSSEQDKFVRETVSAIQAQQ